MRTTNLTLVLLMLAGTALGADGLGTSAGHDLDALWQGAQQNYDLDREDAVLLLESRHVTVSDDGALATRVHRVVWIGTSRGIREYADLRVPWNSATSTLDVEILRTWMDDRWWPDARQIGETAVVHTLPYAVNHADDYTSMRETMLLHDGVELPCIMETAYTIAEQGSPAAGVDGVFVIPQRDPAVLTELVVRAPHGEHFAWQALNSAPVAEENGESGVRTLRWAVEKSAALTLPHTSQPAAHEPTVVWSTWEDWDALDATWEESIEAAAVVGPELAAALDEHLAGSLDPVSDTVAFWNESVRPVHYPFRFWQFAPRAADRTWETGYGHALDRAVLLKALLEHAWGQSAPNPAHATCSLTEPGYGEIAPELARVAGYGGLRVDAGGDALIDADTGEILTVPPLAIWNRHSQRWLESVGRIRALAVSLEPGDEGGWQGHGRLRIENGGMSSWARHDQADAWQARIERIVGSVLEDCEVSNLVLVQPDVRFDVVLSELPDNHDDKQVLTLGSLADGVLDHLPGDVHLHDESRDTPLRIPRDLRESVELRLKVDEREVRTPESVSLVDPTGRFAVETSLEHGWLTVTRTLDLTPADDHEFPLRYLHPSSAWPGLRRLLLESREPAHGRIVLE